jgi:secreted trypsin-like serine protease
MRIISLIVALLFFLSVNLYAGTRDKENQDDIYLKYGSQHPSVIKLEGTGINDNVFLGSGVVIKPQIILTAAHIAKKVKSSYVLCPLSNNKIKVSKYIYPKEFLENTWNGNGYDIAVGYLLEPITLKEYPILYEKNDEIERECSLSGFGISGTFDEGLSISDAQKRAGTNRICFIEEEVLICSPKDLDTHLEFIIAPGDSGGGLFIDNKLAGINSIIFTYGKGIPICNRETYTGHTRISKHKQWILDSIDLLENSHIFSQE